MHSTYVCYRLGTACESECVATSALLPIMAVVFVGFLIIGMALPVLPLHVHQGLGLSTFVVGLIAGSQFVASLISRAWSGHYADSRGAKRAVTVGLLASVGGGLLYLLSLRFTGTPALSASIFFARPCAPWRSRKPYHHRRCQLGAGVGGSRERRQGHRLDRHGNVCCTRLRRASRHNALPARPRSFLLPRCC